MLNREDGEKAPIPQIPHLAPSGGEGNSEIGKFRRKNILRSFHLGSNTLYYRVFLLFRTHVQYTVCIYFRLYLFVGLVVSFVAKSCSTGITKHINISILYTVGLIWYITINRVNLCVLCSMFHVMKYDSNIR